MNREDFLTPETKHLAKIDAPISIGYGQTNSQPSTVKFMLELLNPKPGNKVLDIGSGSGWTTALLAYFVTEKGSVTGLELIPELVKYGNENLKKYNFKRAKIEQAQKQTLGKPTETFDRILVSAAADTFPDELIKQLNINGILVIPVQNTIYKVTKASKEKVKKEEFYGFAFVPLISK